MAAIIAVHIPTNATIDKLIVPGPLPMRVPSTTRTTQNSAETASKPSQNGATRRRAHLRSGTSSVVMRNTLSFSSGGKRPAAKLLEGDGLEALLACLDAESDHEHHPQGEGNSSQGGSHRD